MYANINNLPRPFRAGDLLYYLRMKTERTTKGELTDKEVLRLGDLAAKIRTEILKMLKKAGSGHSAGPLGLTDIFTALYFKVLNHDPKHPEWEERDRLFLSNGHVAPVRYVTMAEAGYFPIAELKTFRQFGSRLQGHPEHRFLPGLENTSGPLGDGLSQAVGMAYAGLMDKKPWQVYCVMSDGELAAGINWEGFLFAHKYRLRNLTMIIDRNYIQIDGFTEDIMPIEPLSDKLAAFGLHVLEIDGHNLREIVAATEEAKATWDRPTVIIAHTIPGKGVSFMERDPAWHGKPPNAEELKRALKELRTLSGAIQSEAS